MPNFRDKVPFDYDIPCPNEQAGSTREQDSCRQRETLCRWILTKTIYYMQSLNYANNNQVSRSTSLAPLEVFYHVTSGSYHFDSQTALSSDAIGTTFLHALKAQLSNGRKIK